MQTRVRLTSCAEALYNRAPFRQFDARARLATSVFSRIFQQFIINFCDGEILKSFVFF